MVYVDAFGDVSPCVFIPVSLGNVCEHDLPVLFDEIRRRFPSSDSCFINKNYKLLRKYSHGDLPLLKDDALEMLKEAAFGPPAEFFRIYDR
jgi:MoaA/NifB/PqqE/SkfB family radical SAM enzyme